MKVRSCLSLIVLTQRFLIGDACKFLGFFSSIHNSNHAKSMVIGTSGAILPLQGGASCKTNQEPLV